MYELISSVHGIISGRSKGNTVAGSAPRPDDSPMPSVVKVRPISQQVPHRDEANLRTLVDAGFGFADVVEAYDEADGRVALAFSILEERDINNIIAVGYAPDAALEAYTICRGNVNAALRYLYTETIAPSSRRLPLASRDKKSTVPFSIRPLASRSEGSTTTLAVSTTPSSILPSIRSSASRGEKSTTAPSYSL